MLSDQDRADILESLDWDWSGSPEQGIPFPNQAAADTFAAVERIVAREKAAALREAAEAHDGPAGPLAFITPEGREWLRLRAEWLQERADRIEAGS